MDKWLDAYVDRFGDRFPTIPLAWGRTDDEVVTIIKDCIDKGKDVYELGYVKKDVVY